VKLECSYQAKNIFSSAGKKYKKIKNIFKKTVFITRDEEKMMLCAA
jgi:hypothetical protein